MRTKWKSLVALLLFLCIAGGGFFLPSLLSGVHDRNLDSRFDNLPVSPVKLEGATDLSLLHRLDIIGHGNVMKADAGRLYNADEATELSIKALDTFFSPIGLTLNSGDFTVESALPWLFVGTEEYHNFASVLIWEILFSDMDGNSLYVQLEEESGCIVGLNILPQVYSDYGIVEDAWNLGDFYGLIPEELLSLLSDLYMDHLSVQGPFWAQDQTIEYTSDHTVYYFFFVMTDGNASAHIQVTLTATGFTINPTYAYT